MLYTRVTAHFTPRIHPRLFNIREGEELHPLAEHYCPACGHPLIEDGRIVLVPVGIAPDEREEGGWVNAGCVAVHLDCSGYTEMEIAQLAAAPDPT